MTDLEILQSLPSLYPLKDFEEEAILNVCKMFQGIETEIEDEIRNCQISLSYDAWWRGRKNGLIDALAIIDKHIGKEQK